MVGRVVLTFLFYEDPPILLTSFFSQILSTTPPAPLPCHLQPLPTLLFLLSYLFGWMGDLTLSDVLFYLMLLWIYTCWAFVPYYQKVYYGLTHNVAFYWYSDLVIPHTAGTSRPVDWHSGTSRLRHPYKCIFTPPVMCKRQLPSLH